MTITQLRRFAEYYGCHVDRGLNGQLELCSPNYEHRVPIADIKPQEMVKMLEELSGKKTAELWIGEVKR
jgi:hypothetical protein